MEGFIRKAIVCDKDGKPLGSDGGALNVALYGTDDSGTPRAVPSTGEGHLEVAVHSPRLPFGSIDVAEMKPEIQADAVYGLNATIVRATTAGSGTATASNNLFTVSNNGTTAGNIGSIQSRRRLRYRPGQGVVGRFTALFTSGVTGCTQVAGIGSAESGYYFGYNGSSFGILHSTEGVREIQTLTVTTASTATNDYVVTLAGTAFNVTATDNSSTVKTAYEISQGTFTGWTAVQRGSTVIFLSNTAGDKSGTFSLAQTGAVTPAAGSFVETLAGAGTSDTWYPQTSWNGDKLDGTGASGVTLDPTRGNVYQIDVQYLGFGSVTFKVETAVNGNNPDFVTVHSISFPNTRTTVHTSQPSFPFTMAAANTATASGTATVKCGSFAGFIAGAKKLVGPRMSYYGTGTSSTSAYVPLFTVRNDITYASRANQSVVNIISTSGAAKSTNGLTTFYLIKNATLTGTPNFAQFAVVSPTYLDTAATGCSFSTNDQVVYSASVATDGGFAFAFSDEITLQPGETLTMAVRSVTGTANCVAQLNTREDH